MLKDSEWNTINSILLDLYTVNDVKEIAGKTLSVLRLLIPFSKGYFTLLDDYLHIQEENSVFTGFEDSDVEKYIKTFHEKDYLQYLYSFTNESSVYQDSVMIEDSVRRETDFYRLFLSPLGIPFGAGIVLVKNQKVLGVFNLFRGENLGDFSEKDLYILNILKKHLENMVSNAILITRSSPDSELSLTKAVEDFSLSSREADVLKLLADGRSNMDISEEIHVSVSTVKKHVYNIFNKAGVNSRTQLLNMIYTK
ncbi:MAG: LuxR C-terminal-related transcriptional regulator [Treponema sp.]|nr:LuxR C-terminal-related transcriptional regulator [Treponema sp.]